MTIRGQALLYGASLVTHGLIALGVGSIEPPAPRAPLRVVVVTERPEVPPLEAEVPEPEPTPPPPEVAPVAEPAPLPRAPREPRAAAPEPAVAEAAPVPAGPAPPPDFGLAMAGSGPGIAVPAGSPDGVPGGTGSGRRAREVERTLEAPPAAQREDEGCAEAATRPRPLSMPSPEYTEAARAAEIEGRVRVEIRVDASGAVVEARVLSPLESGLDEAALAAARAARFEPATRCGEAVEATFTVSIRFQF
jgi:protein TonB